MGRSTVLTRRPDRFQQLTAAQDAEFQGKTGDLVLTGKLRSYNGKPENAPHFKAALKGFKADVAKFESAVALTDGFVLVCNEPGRRSPRAFETLRSQLNNGLLEFARAKRLQAKPLKEWPADLGHRVVAWLRKEALKDNGELYFPETLRKYYGAFCSLFACMKETPKLAALLPQLEDFPRNPFSGLRGSGNTTQSMGQSALIDTLNAARDEFLEVVHKVRYAQQLFAGPEVPPDTTKRGEGQFRNLDAVLWYLKTSYRGKLPMYTTLAESDVVEERAVYEAISRFHGGWRNVSEYLQPAPESCVAPMLLLTIYGHFNTDALRTLGQKNLKRKDVLNNGRLEVRLTVRPGKQRGSTYARSFPIDDADPCSPNSILELMVAWTERIRSEAGKYKDCIFIHVTNENAVKAFASAKLDGRGGDTKWLHHLAEFCERHKLDRFNLRELRMTSLDYGMWMFADDIRASFALKGGKSESVLRDHYIGESARQRSNARVAELQSNKERYVRTGGKVHHLGSDSKDISAATPGCKCVDTFDSPIPGEVKGRQCGAFGRCPGCPLGSPELTAYGLARMLQLREQLKEARKTMPLERWKACWDGVLKTLERKWIPLFKNKPQLWERVKRMSLPPIGVIE
ncbi:hypothetical protein [Ramlibacter humi]|uniref:Uncharacterized protein n=1 Tax=Ramlibacter humi TaxID=2530451 RepID=A0A4Z0CEV1_9BURK|nr:hypothetical protein [Ramlibacter humi]TFZ08929.1 hypothetical protein EZ216_07245 [Ramlibacter humi]